MVRHLYEGKLGKNTSHRPHQPFKKNGQRVDDKEKNLRFYNKEISRLSEHKKIGEALLIFRKILESRIKPNIITYTALLNGFVRTNEMNKALEIFIAICLSTKPEHITILKAHHHRMEWYFPTVPIIPNVVTYTTLIKGLCNNGMIVEAWDILWPLLIMIHNPIDIILANLIKHPSLKRYHTLNEFSYPSTIVDTVDSTLQPLLINSRCINTFLRGCVRTGDILTGWCVYQLCCHIQTSKHIQLLDETSISLIIKLLTEGQYLKEAITVLRYFQGILIQSTSIPENIKNDSECRSETDDNTSNSLTSNISSSHIPCEVVSELQEETALTELTLSKDNNETRLLSADIFINISRCCILRGDYKKAKKYIKKAIRQQHHIQQLLDGLPSTTSFSQSALQFSHHQLKEQERDICTLKEFITTHQEQTEQLLTIKAFKKLFFFPPNNSRVPFNKLSLCTKEANVTHWEHDHLKTLLCDRLVDEISSHKKMKQIPVDILESHLGIINLGAQMLIDTDDNKSLKSLFYRRCMDHSPQLNLNFIFKQNQSCRLEICSGSGDWIVSQAIKYPHINWVAMELRHDRIYQIFISSLMAGLNNLCILGGNATQIIQSQIQPNIFDKVRNHHEMRLFYFAINRILQQKCQLIIVSDDIQYLKMLGLAIVRQLSQLYTPINKVSPYIINGFPDGFGTDSSYFDRFWTNGTKQSRGHLIFTVTK